MIKTTEWITPATDLQQDAIGVLQKAEHRPLIVTDGGRPKVYVLSVTLFDQLLERLIELEQADLHANIAVGENQFATGDFLSLQEAITIAEAKWQQESPV